jgi:hypothetical protein
MGGKRTRNPSIGDVDYVLRSLSGEFSRDCAFRESAKERSNHSPPVKATLRSGGGATGDIDLYKKKMHKIFRLGGRESESKYSQSTRPG